MKHAKVDQVKQRNGHLPQGSKKKGFCLSWWVRRKLIRNVVRVILLLLGVWDWFTYSDDFDAKLKRLTLMIWLVKREREREI